MTYEAILLDVKDQVATITLNRPENLNAWTTEMAAELSDALTTCNQRDEVRAVVITGAGRAFCAGADLGKGGESFASSEEEREEQQRALQNEIFPWMIDKPDLLYERSS